MILREVAGRIHVAQNSLALFFLCFVHGYFVLPRLADFNHALDMPIGQQAMDLVWTYKEKVFSVRSSD